MTAPSTAKKPLPSLPTPVRRALRRQGEDISLARRLRGWSQEDMALRLDVSVSTVRRLEDGYPGTALHTFIRALHLFGRLEAMLEVLAPEQDPLGMALVRDQAPKRVVSARKTPKTKGDEPYPQGVGSGTVTTDDLEGF